MRLDLVDLQLFIHVAEDASITRGAVRSNLALASASGRIRKIEELAGVALLERGRRGVGLTPAGRAFAHHARLVLQQIEHMKSELSAHAGGLKGHVRVQTNASALSEFLPEVLKQFLVAHPGIDVDLEERSSYDIVRSVAEGFAEIGIVADIVDFGDLQAHPLAIDRLVVVTPKGHPIARQRRPSFRSLLDHEFVGLAATNALQQHLAQHAIQAGKPLKLRVRLGSFDAVCRMVGNGIGLAVIPEPAARRCKRTTPIDISPLADPWALRHLHVCARRADELPAPARLLWQHLRQHSHSQRDLPRSMQARTSRRYEKKSGSRKKARRGSIESGEVARWPATRHL